MARSEDYVDLAAKYRPILQKELEDPLVQEIWDKKYRRSDQELDPFDSMLRVAKGVFARDPKKHTWIPNVLQSMCERWWVPGGRIQAGAGTMNRVTLINCFVNETVEDSMVGIMRAVSNAAFTMQYGGGIGTDFSSIRPAGAIVKATNSVSSGVIPFARIWDTTCETMMSAGDRRGAMMTTLRIDHPDVIEFITSKRTKDALENTNISVLITDLFMKTLESDGDWHLGFSVPPADPSQIVTTLTKEGGGLWYVYKTVKARYLWDLILKHSHEYSEPGVIFIDRVNERNNLKYCETISCTNPCGEQPLPPHGDCNLGAINLARMVENPFLPTAKVNFERITATVTLGMRFLDNVLDVSQFPLDKQRQEAMYKRRTGLGITGLGNMLQMVGARYGSESAVLITKSVMEHIKLAAYQASCDLAEERGPFPLFEKDKYLATPFIKTLPDKLRSRIRERGIRNGVLLTIAPTGTTSIYCGNVSSGIEPTFLWKYDRKVLQPDGTLKSFGEVVDYGYRLYHEVMGKRMNGGGLPEHMVTTADLTVEDHLRMMGACQPHVDAAISKTINLAEQITYDDFKQVYTDAYVKYDLKGCTTYKPSKVRGSVLSAQTDAVTARRPRPRTLAGTTTKLEYPTLDHAYYVTLTDEVDVEGKHRPFEIFFNSVYDPHEQWTRALSTVISEVFQRTDDPTFIVDRLQKIKSLDSGFKDGKVVYSIPAEIGKIIQEHLTNIGFKAETPTLTEKKPERCKRCGSTELTFQEGCDKCQECGFSSCG